MKNKLKLSTRVKDLMASPIRKFYPLALEAKKKGIEVLKLNIGDPDLSVPGEIIKSFQNIKLKNLGYAPSSGLVEQVDAWRIYYKGWGINLERENIIPTTGATEGILFSLLAVADPGDEILVFEPLYTNYKALAGLVNVRLRPVTLKLENDFQLPAEAEIIKKINNKTRAIIVINPDNPTGKVWSEQELRLIIKIARKYKLYIIADETYREIVFGGQPGSILQNEQARERTILLDSVSKRFSVPGMRIGVIASYNQELMRGILKIAMARLSAPTIGQIVTNKSVAKARDYTDRITKEYRQRAMTVQAGLKKIPGIVYNQPAGAFYQVIKLPVENADDFIRFLVSDFSYQGQTILVSPMEDFYLTAGLGRQEIRLAYVLNEKKLKKAVEILGRGIVEYSKKI